MRANTRIPLIQVSLQKGLSRWMIVFLSVYLKVIISKLLLFEQSPPPIPRQEVSCTSNVIPDSDPESREIYSIGGTRKTLSEVIAAAKAYLNSSLRFRRASIAAFTPVSSVPDIIQATFSHAPIPFEFHGL